MNKHLKILLYITCLTGVAVVYVLHNFSLQVNYSVMVDKSAPQPYPVPNQGFDFASAVGLPVALYIAKKILDIIFSRLEKKLDKSS